MPTRSATLRIETASPPSSSSSARAASTSSCARGLRALEAIAGAEPVADGAVDGDVERPGERADEVAAGEHAERRERAERDRAGETVERVVERDGARVELPALEPAAGAGEQRDVG